MELQSFKTCSSFLVAEGVIKANGYGLAKCFGFLHAYRVGEGLENLHLFGEFLQSATEMRWIKRTICAYVLLHTNNYCRPTMHVGILKIKMKFCQTGERLVGEQHSHFGRESLYITLCQYWDPKFILNNAYFGYSEKSKMVFKFHPLWRFATKLWNYFYF